MRLRRGHVRAAIGVVTATFVVALAAGVLLTDGWHDAPPVDVLVTVADVHSAAAPPRSPTAATPEARVTELRRIAGDVEPLVALLTREPDGDPQLRAMALTALARHAADERARAAVLGALSADRPREERLLALSVVSDMFARVDERRWARPALDAAAADVDPQVRRAARQVLDMGGERRGDGAER